MTPFIDGARLDARTKRSLAATSVEFMTTCVIWIGRSRSAGNAAGAAGSATNRYACASGPWTTKPLPPPGASSSANVLMGAFARCARVRASSISAGGPENSIARTAGASAASTARM